MSDRDTHFQGFARRLWIELLAHSTFECKSMRSAEYGAEMEQIIARRAYDLAYHILTHETMDVEAEEYRSVDEVLADDIPDLAEWSKPN